MPDHVGPLPQRVGSEAVDEEKVGLVLVAGLGDPAVHDGSVFQVCDGGSKPRFDEGGPEAAVLRLGEAETLGHRKLLRRV